MKLIDLSVLVENSLSEPMDFVLERFGYIEGAKKICRTIAWNKHLPLKIRLRNFFAYIMGKRKLLPSDFPNKAFISLDTITMPTHMGTHIDAPFHFGPSTVHEGKTIDELPLDWFFRPGVKLDMRHKQAGDYITVADIKEALLNINYNLAPYDIVLIWTNMDKFWGKKEYFFNAPGMSRQATEWLINKGIKVIGIDTYSFDRPFEAMLKDFWQTKDKSHLWPAHFIGRDKEYVHIERLAQLDQLPSVGFHVSCFPIKIKGADAGWIRAVGVLDNKQENICE